MTSRQIFSPKSLISAWAAIAVSLVVPTALFLAFHHEFDYERTLAQIPSVYLATGLVLTGLAFLSLLPLIRASRNLPANTTGTLLVFIVVFGLALRAVLLWTTPALEDDYNRYLWDGAVTAAGINPYAHAPDAITHPGTPEHLAELAKQSGNVFERINHSQLKTVYPPLAQGAFALAHFIKPWSLEAWRVICLFAEIATLILVLALLHTLGRSPLWAALYWWNPLVIKEMINSAHTEALLMPFVLAAVLAAAHRKHVLATTLIGLAAGVKIWPIVLAPLVLRPLLDKPKQLITALSVLAALCAMWIIPPILGGFNESSGFVAYATQWKTNSALSAALAHINELLLQPLGLSAQVANRVLRAGLGLVLLGVVIRVSAPQLKGADDLVARATFIVIAVLLLIPAQFPWYVVWVLPFMPLRPVLAMLVAAALVPVYYSSFYFYAHGHYNVFTDQVVWLIWLPVWAILIWEIKMRDRPKKSPSP